MANYLLQFISPEELDKADDIMSESSSIMMSVCDSDVLESVQSGVMEEPPAASGPTSCEKQAAPSQGRKGPVIYKTPDYSKVKPKVCAAKGNDTIKSRSGVKKESELPMFADGGRELRKQISTYKTPDYSKVKPKVKSRLGAKKESGPASSADDRKELRKVPLHHKTPDYSQVEAKVHFPKNSYTPPKSRFCGKKDSDLSSCADPMKEATLHQEDDMLLLQIYSTLHLQLSKARNAIDELRLKPKQDELVPAETHSGTVTPESPLSPTAPSSPLHQMAPVSCSPSPSSTSLSHHDDALTSLTSSESESSESDERMSDVSSGTEEHLTAVKSTQMPTSTETSASGSKPQPNLWRAGGDSGLTHIVYMCHCLCCRCPKAAIKWKPSVQRERWPCVAACTSPHRFCSRHVSERHPHTAAMTPTTDKGDSFKVKGHTETSSSVCDSLDQALRIAGEILKSCSRTLESGRRCQQLLSESHSNTDLKGAHDRVQPNHRYEND